MLLFGTTLPDSPRHVGAFDTQCDVVAVVNGKCFFVVTTHSSLTYRCVRKRALSLRSILHDSTGDNRACKLFVPKNYTSVSSSYAGGQRRQQGVDNYSGDSAVASVPYYV